MIWANLKAMLIILSGKTLTLLLQKIKQNNRAKVKSI
jgi:hypothetical protein